MTNSKYLLSLFFCIASLHGADCSQPIINRRFVGLPEVASTQDYLTNLHSFAQSLFLQDRIITLLRFSIQSDNLKYLLDQKLKDLSLGHINAEMQKPINQNYLPTLQLLYTHLNKNENLLREDAKATYGSIAGWFTSPKALALILMHINSFKHLDSLGIPKSLVDAWCMSDDNEVNYIGRICQVRFEIRQQCKLADIISKGLNPLMLLCLNQSNNCTNGMANNLLSQLKNYQNSLFELQSLSKSLTISKPEIPSQNDPLLATIFKINEDLKTRKITSSLISNFSLSDLEKQTTAKHENIVTEYFKCRSECTKIYEATIKELQKIIKEECSKKKSFTTKVNLYKFLNDLDNSRLPDNLNQLLHPEFLELQNHPELTQYLANFEFAKKQVPSDKQSQQDLNIAKDTKTPSHKQKKQQGKQVLKQKRHNKTTLTQPQTEKQKGTCTTGLDTAAALPSAVATSSPSLAAIAAAAVACSQTAQSNIETVNLDIKEKVSIQKKENILEEICTCCATDISQIEKQQNKEQPEQQQINQGSFILPYNDGHIIQECAEYVVINDQSAKMIITLLSNAGKRPPTITLPLDYQHNVLAWFENAHDALKSQGYFNFKSKKYAPYQETQLEMVNIHRFSKLVDQYIPSKGIFRLVPNRDNANIMDLTISIPGIIDYPNGHRVYCIFQYIIDGRTRKCFHRNIVNRTNMELTAEFMDKGYYDIEFPALS